MFRSARKTITAIAALGALALGGAAIANAASSGSSSSSSGSSTTTSPSAPGPTVPPPGGAGPGNRPPGPHIGANGKQEVPLTGDTAAKVKAAALAKISGGTVERVETDVDHGSPYEAHVRKSDGAELEVLVNKAFEVTAVNTMRH